MTARLLAEGATPPDIWTSLAGFAATVLLILAARLIERYLPSVPPRRSPPPPEECADRRQRTPDDTQ